MNPHRAAGTPEAHDLHRAAEAATGCPARLGRLVRRHPAIDGGEDLAPAASSPRQPT